MTRISKPARLRASGLATAFALASLGATSACAHETASITDKPYAHAESESTRISLNLLGEPRPSTRTVRKHSMGNGSYMCSLAGLGQKSRCVRN